MANGDTKTQSYLRAAAEGSRADLPTDTCCNTKTQDLILGVAERIMDVEDEVERLENNPDVVDIVATYQDLQNYDTSGLTDKDIIRVLEDSTHSNNSTYYRWDANTNQFDFVGEIGGGSSVNVVQTSGTSTTDVMSQNAVTSMVFADPATKEKIQVGSSSSAGSIQSDAIGAYSTAKNFGLAVGYGSYAGIESVSLKGRADGRYSVAIGRDARVDENWYSIALGTGARVTRRGEMNIGTGSDNQGYNNTKYRVLGGVHDPVDAHDAATKGYVDANASVATFYMSVNPYADRSGVSLYSDIALTTAVPASTFVQALRDCKSVFLVYKSGDLDWSERYIAQIISSYVPNVDTAEAYDEIFPAGYYSDGTTGKSYMIQSATSDPDDTASFNIVRRT